MTKIQTKKQAEQNKTIFQILGFALIFGGLFIGGMSVALGGDGALGLSSCAIGVCELLIANKYSHLLNRHGDELV